MYTVKEGCPGCGACQGVCPVNAITPGSGLAVVINEDCIGCGVCAGTCPIGLIERVPEKDPPESKGNVKKSPSDQVKGGAIDG